MNESEVEEYEDQYGAITPDLAHKFSELLYPFTCLSPVHPSGSYSHANSLGKLFLIPKGG